MTTIWSSTSRQYVSTKFDKSFNYMSNVFGIADDILAIGYEGNGKDHDETGHKVLQRCRELNLKLNEDKCHFRCMSIPFFREVISRNGSATRPTQNQSPNGNATPNNK